jgi:hypothetical protein
VEPDPHVDVGAQPDGRSIRVAGIRQAARWCLAGVVIQAVAVVTDVTFHLAWLPLAGATIQTVTLVLLVWRLDELLPRTGTAGVVATALGTATILLWPASIIGWRLVRDLSLLVPLSVGLVGAWLIAFGRARTGLPRPLPRRAVVGGTGYLLFAAWYFAAPSPAGWAAMAVGLFCAVSVLGLIFGLIDLDQLTGPASA